MESFFHKYAKQLLSEWWEEKHYFGIKPERIDIEKTMCMDGVVQFIPDLTIYDINGIKMFVEIFYTSKVSISKLQKMILYGYKHNFDPVIIEISSASIMRQVRIPNRLHYDLLYQPFSYSPYYGTGIYKQEETPF